MFGAIQSRHEPRGCFKSIQEVQMRSCNPYVQVFWLRGRTQRLEESFPAETMVDGLPRVRSVFFELKINDFSWKPNSFKLGLFFQFRVWNEDSDAPSLTSRERASKNPERAQLSPLGVVVTNFHENSSFPRR